jgi:hypothetical protein
MNKGNNKGNAANWRARFFWVSEWVYALIGGSFEAAVYHAYTPAGADAWITWGESILRACITQILVVLLAVAAVEMWRSGAHGVAKVLGFASIQVFAVLFAFVAFWLMRVAAMAFQQTSILGTALDTSLPVPFLGDVSAQEMTLDIVAALPFFQLVINLFAPIITKERRQLSAEEIRVQAEAELAAIEYTAKKRAAQMRGLGATFAAAKAAVTQGATSGVDGVQSSGIAGANHDGNGVQTLGNGDAANMAADGLPPGVRKLRPAGRGPWLKDDMVAYIANTYPGVTISEPAAMEAIKDAGKGAMKGKAYCATITQAKAWVKRHYGEPRGEVEHGQDRAEVRA